MAKYIIIFSVIQCIFAILTAWVDRSKMKPRPKRIFQCAMTLVAILATILTGLSTMKNAERVARLEAVAPNENEIGELVFKGEPLPYGNLQNMRADGAVFPGVILRTRKSVLFDEGMEAYNNNRARDGEKPIMDALKIDPDFVAAHLLLADIKRLTGDKVTAMEEAVWVLKRAKKGSKSHESAQKVVDALMK